MKRVKKSIIKDCIAEINEYNDAVKNGTTTEDLSSVLERISKKAGIEITDDEILSKANSINKSNFDDMNELIEKINRKLSEFANNEELEEDNYEFYKKNENDTIWWVNNRDTVGEHLFSFDKKKVFNLFRDYPHELTPGEKEIFDKENQFWADFFKDRDDNNLGKILNCPICKNPLMFMEPDGNTLWCNKCNKYFANNNGSVGSETSSPYDRDDVLY